MMKNRKFTEVDIVISMLMIALGLVFIFVPYGNLISFLFIVLGIYIIVNSIPTCIAYFLVAERDKKYLPYAICSLVTVLIGFAFIFWHNMVLTFILAVWLIVFPIVRIVLDENKKERLKKELPLLIIGALLFFTPFDSVIGVVLKVFGGLIALYGVIYFVLSVISVKKNDGGSNHIEPNSSNSPKDYIDVDVKEV